MRVRCEFAAWLCALAVAASTTAIAAAQSTESGALAGVQALVDRTVAKTVAEFERDGLRQDQLAITLVEIMGAGGVPSPRAIETTRSGATWASHRGDVPIYPASVIKLFYLAAAHAWLERGELSDTPELRRALRDMIVDSSNDATSYVVDLLTGTTSGPELPESELARWFDQRNAVNRYFAERGYLEINVNKKPWGDGPYGRESQATQRYEPKRNALTTDSTARLLVEISEGRCVSPARSKQMLELLFRESANPDEQAQFINSALPPGSKQWSKAGWTSQTRHIAAYLELPSGAKCVLVIFTVEHAKNPAILPVIANQIVGALMSHAAKQ